VRRCFVGTLAALAALSFCGEANAALAYRAWPAVMDIHVPAGQTISGEFHVRNNQQTDALEMKFEPRDVRQRLDGNKEIIEGEGEVAPRPCAGWVTLEPQNAHMPPLGEAVVRFTVSVPKQARGFYAAGLLCIPPPPPPNPEAGGMAIGVVVRVALGLRINVTGRAPSEKAAVREAELMELKHEESHPTTGVRVRLANMGETLLDMAPQVVILKKSGERLTRVWSGTAGKIEVLPTAEVDYTVDTGRRLPGGEYLVRAEAMHLGRRLDYKQLTLTLQGAPAGRLLTGELPITVSPVLIEVNVRSGALRTAGVTIQNDGDTPVKVRLGIEEPKQLAILRQRYQITREYSCHPWTTVTPTELTVQPHRSSRARLAVAIPSTAAGSYYARLVADCTDPELQATGQVESLVWAITPGAAEYGGALGTIEIAREEQSQYAFTVPITNTGTVHFVPQGHLEIRDASGNTVKSSDLKCADDMVLRDATSQLTASVDLAALTSGAYTVRASAILDKSVGPVTMEESIIIEWNEGQQEVRSVEPETSEKQAPQVAQPATGETGAPQ